MRTVSVHEAKTHPSRLLERVAEGDEIIIARNGKPVARLVAIKTDQPKVILGSDRGRVRIASDFNKTPEELVPYTKS